VCAGTAHPDRCVKRKKILITCAKSAHVRACLRKHAVLLKCLQANVTSVTACVTANENADVKKIVNGLLNKTLGGGSGGLPGVP
jgi:hypothetical protein